MREAGSGAERVAIGERLAPRRGYESPVGLFGRYDDTGEQIIGHIGRLLRSNAPATRRGHAEAWWRFSRPAARCGRPTLLNRAAHGFRTGAAAGIRAIAHKFLDAFSFGDFAGIEIAFAVDGDLVQPVEITNHAAGMAYPA